MARFVHRSRAHVATARLRLAAGYCGWSSMFAHRAASRIRRKRRWRQHDRRRRESSGVVVDADGVLRRVTANDPTGDLARQRVQEATAQARSQRRASQPAAQSFAHAARTHHERAPRRRARTSTTRCKHLAGLTRLQYVFCYPESGDIVIAGPAEAWGQAPSGRMQAIDSGRPVLELHDLAVAPAGLPARRPTTRSRSSIARSIRPKKASRGCTSSCTSSAAASATRDRIQGRINSSSMACANGSACKSSPSAAFRRRPTSPKSQGRAGRGGSDRRGEVARRARSESERG